MLFSLTKIPCFLATGTELETSNVYTHIFSLSSPKGFVTDVLSQGAGVHVTPTARTPEVVRSWDKSRNRSDPGTSRRDPIGIPPERRSESPSVVPGSNRPDTTHGHLRSITPVRVGGGIFPRSGAPEL